MTVSYDKLNPVFSVGTKSRLDDNVSLSEIFMDLLTELTPHAINVWELLQILMTNNVRVCKWVIGCASQYEALPK